MLTESGLNKATGPPHHFIHIIIKLRDPFLYYTYTFLLDSSVMSLTVNSVVALLASTRT
jgi:hypothetical protein